MAPIQKAIRDLERCMKKKKEKGESTEFLEKKLALLYDDKTISEQIQKEKRNAAKYHMIKFVERQKLVRKIRSLDLQIAADEDGTKTASLNDSKSVLMEKLAYVLYYPKDMKYVALFADTEGDTVGKNEKLRLKAHALAVEHWKNDKITGAQDRVMRVILGEDKETCTSVSQTSGSKRNSSSNDDDEEEGGDNADQEPGMLNRINKKRTDTVEYGGKVIMPKKKKQKVTSSAAAAAVEKEEVIDDFPAGQEPDSFFLEEEIIESKKSAQQSLNMKYPPEKKHSRTSTPYGSYGPDKKFGGKFDKKNHPNFGGNKKPAYGSWSFSSFEPSKQSARLQKWQQRKSHH
jgi:rRNA-processing protein Efg1